MLQLIIIIKKILYYKYKRLLLSKYNIRKYKVKFCF